MGVLTLNIEYWLTDDKNIEYYDYWNDEENEKNKEWYILDGNFAKMEHYLEKTRLPDDLKACVDILKVDFKRELKGIGIDLAAGNLWAVPHLFSLGKIRKLYCLEYSKHRLLRIGPKVLDYYNVLKDRIILVYGSFYDLHLDGNSIDFVLLSSAFHHADNPGKLLSEISRVLKQDGVAIIIGEHIINLYRTYFKHAAKMVVSIFVPKSLQKRLFNKIFQVNRLFPKPIELFPPDPVLGDHYYTNREYQSMFSQYQFRVRRLKGKKSPFQSFILVR